MPNYSQNTTRFSHEDKEKIDALEWAIKNKEELGELPDLFQTIYSLPEDATDEDRIRAWGTKWDVCDVEYYVRVNDHHCVYAFLTVHTPPIGIYKILESQGYRIRTEWYDEANGSTGLYETK